ncbi:unnamed protein product [Sphenostylis stenocarpa]|uniref:Uncharacterized protein n=1 Tax=Sphenostylis stenocarpa TaxID=92480 RepID=A0AA86W3I9_9FABA|nr:unnamed protein product [Sphenostylis stenocarpa]
MCLDKDVTNQSVVYLAKSAPYEPFMLVLPLLYQILSLFTTHAFEVSLYSINESWYFELKTRTIISLQSSLSSQ